MGSSSGRRYVKESTSNKVDLNNVPITKDDDSVAKGAKKQKLSDEIAFVICVLGIYMSYLLFGYLQEELMLATFGPNQEKLNNTSFLVFVQCVGNCICVWLAILFLNEPKDNTPQYQYMLIASSYVGAMYSSNYAINYVSFPMMVLAKSCKPIPVLLSSVLVFGKKQSFLKWLCVLLVTAGITIFTMDDRAFSSSKETTLHGIAFLMLSLTLDGVTGPVQDRTIHKYNPSEKRMMLYTNIWASIYLGIVLLFTGSGYQGIMFCIKHPGVIPHVALFSMSSAIGQNFIYFCIKRFGSLACSLITTTRKFFTILCSVIMFGHTLGAMQWTGVGVVFIGLGIDIYNSYNKRKTA